LILLDENTDRGQFEALQSKHIPVRKVGVNWGRSGMSDGDILSKLRGSRQITFFTTDAGFYGRANCHAAYCAVYVAAPEREFAAYVIRLLRHRSFRTHGMRMGKVVRIQPRGIVYWERHRSREIEVGWA